MEVHVKGNVHLAPLRIRPQQVTSRRIRTAILRCINRFRLPIRRALLLNSLLRRTGPLHELPIASTGLIGIRDVIVRMVAFVTIVRDVRGHKLAVIRQRRHRSLFLQSLTNRSRQRFHRMLQSYKGRLHLISKPRPRQTPMIRNRFRTDMFTNILNLFQVMNGTRRLVFLTGNRIITARMFIFGTRQTLPVLLLTFRDLHNLFKNIHIGPMSGRVILDLLFRLLTHFGLTPP